MATSAQYKFLSDEQVQHFMDHGYLVIKNAFTQEKADQYTKDLWIRIGLDPNDKSTWQGQERLHLPKLRFERAETFSPKAWGAMCELLGGEDRLEDNSALWGDSFILNLGRDQDENVYTPADKLDNWHVDGDFFIHYLDSPEQALLVIPIFSKISPHGGATYITPNSISAVAKHLLNHPEGLQPGLKTPEEELANTEWHSKYYEFLKECGDHFVELTGDVGDVILMHPLMMHSASKNSLRIPRIITNPPVSLRKPFNFNRSDPSQFSLVERKTLKALGVDRVDFKPTTERKRVIPAAWAVKDEKKRKELVRLKEHAIRNGLPIPEICV